jgi:hypothetical protein
MTKTSRISNIISHLLPVALLTSGVVACSLNEPASAPATAPRIGVTMIATQPVTPIAPLPTPTLSTSDATAVVPVAETTTPAGVPSECSIPVQDVTPPEKPATFTATAQALAAYLSAGASVTATEELLKSWGNIFNQPGSDVQAGDVQSAWMLPARDAVVVAIYYDPADQQMATRRGDVVVFQCAGGVMQVAYQASADPTFSEVLNPRLFGNEDVTGDGAGELIFIVGDCGASTCFDGINILAVANGAITNLIPGFEWVAFPTFDFVPSRQGAAQDLLVQEGYLESVSAGPQRAITDTWAFNGTVFTFTMRAKEPPVHRIHALQDADDAFRRNDLAAANALYQRVIGDPGLQSWQGSAPLRNEPEVLAAFAYVRLMQTAATAGDTVSLDAAHDALLMAAPEGSPGEIFAQLGEAFYNAYQQGAEYQQACDATVRFAQKNQNTFIVLGRETFGYANNDYQATDMCIVP